MFASPQGVTPEQWVRRIESMRKDLRSPTARDAKVGWDMRRILFGKPNADIAKGASGNVTVYNVKTGSATSRVISAKALAAQVKSAKWVTLIRADGQWVVSPWECP